MNAPLLCALRLNAPLLCALTLNAPLKNAGRSRMMPYIASGSSDVQYYSYTVGRIHVVALSGEGGRLSDLNGEHLQSAATSLCAAVASRCPQQPSSCCFRFSVSTFSCAALACCSQDSSPCRCCKFSVSTSSCAFVASCCSQEASSCCFRFSVSTLSEFSGSQCSISPELVTDTWQYRYPDSVVTKRPSKGGGSS